MLAFWRPAMLETIGSTRRGEWSRGLARFQSEDCFTQSKNPLVIGFELHIASQLTMSLICSVPSIFEGHNQRQGRICCCGFAVRPLVTVRVLRRVVKPVTYEEAIADCHVVDFRGHATAAPSSQSVTVDVSKRGPSIPGPGSPVSGC